MLAKMAETHAAVVDFRIRKLPAELARLRQKSFKDRFVRRAAVASSAGSKLAERATPGGPAGSSKSSKRAVAATGQSFEAAAATSTPGTKLTKRGSGCPGREGQRRTVFLLLMQEEAPSTCS